MGMICSVDFKAGNGDIFVVVSVVFLSQYWTMNGHGKTKTHHSTNNKGKHRFGLFGFHWLILDNGSTHYLSVHMMFISVHIYSFPGRRSDINVFIYISLNFLSLFVKQREIMMDIPGSNFTDFKEGDII